MANSNVGVISVFTNLTVCTWIASCLHQIQINKDRGDIHMRRFLAVMLQWLGD